MRKFLNPLDLEDLELVLLFLAVVSWFVLETLSIVLRFLAGRCQ